MQTQKKKKVLLSTLFLNCRGETKFRRKFFAKLSFKKARHEKSKQDSSSSERLARLIRSATTDFTSRPS